MSFNDCVQTTGLYDDKDIYRYVTGSTSTSYLVPSLQVNGVRRLDNLERELINRRDCVYFPTVEDTLWEDTHVVLIRGVVSIPPNTRQGGWLVESLNIRLENYSQTIYLLINIETRKDPIFRIVLHLLVPLYDY